MIILLVGLLRETVPLLLTQRGTTPLEPSSTDRSFKGGRGPPIVSPEGECAANLIQESPAGCWYLVRAPGMGN